MEQQKAGTGLMNNQKMKTLFLLSKQDINLARKEILALTESKEYELIDNLLIINTDFKDYQRLAYTKRIYQLLFITFKRNLEKENFVSEFVHEFHYKIFNCKCGEKVFINVDFLGSGHDSWNEEVRQDNSVKTIDDKVK